MTFSLQRFLIILLLVLEGSIFAQKPKELFRSDDVLEMTLSFNEKEVFKDMEERNLHEASIQWTKADGSKGEIGLNVQVRGKTRAMKSTCKFPPLFLNFKGSETKNTPFKKQKKIKLVTHCKSSKSFKEYVKKEYLAYRLYNIVSPYGFKVRLCRITYRDSKNPDDEGVTQYGFLIESIKDLAKRNEMKEYEGLLRNQESLDKNNLDRLTMFEYMIGNLDWSIPKRHNIKIMKGENNSLPVGVPYDFDYSGLVNTPYAVPPEGFDIESVKTRVFRGLCRDQGYGATVDYFKGIQPEITKEINTANYMDEKTITEVLNYIQSFYKSIANPQTVTKEINEACWAKHKHIYEN